MSEAEEQGRRNFPSLFAVVLFGNSILRPGIVVQW